MRTAIILGALAALTAAVPYPQEQEDPGNDPEDPTRTTAVPMSTSLNIPVTDRPTSSKRNPHWEPIPVFTKQCQCALETARYPCWATDALQRCHFEENFSYGCYMQAAGGCPTPTRVCSKLFEPTPRPGRHPCELVPNPPLITDAPATASSPVVVWPTLNITTLGVVRPTLNMSLPVEPTANVTVTLPSASVTSLV